MNLVWLLLIVGGMIVAALTGRVEDVGQAALSSAQYAVDLIIGLVGAMMLWMGMMKIAEKSGLMDALARAFRPAIGLLFPELPKGHPAAGAILMNVAANLLGVGNAATPLGLKAMQDLETLNPEPGTATPSMCTFLALNTSSVTLIPASVVALRAAAGSANPTEIVGSTFLATLVAGAVALATDRVFRRLDSAGGKEGRR